MRRWLWATLLPGLLGMTALCAQETKETYPWDATTNSISETAVQTVEEGGVPALQVLNANALPLRQLLRRIENPPIGKPRYALRGQVRYEGVQGEAYLEMWSEFAPANGATAGGRFFTRTLASEGPLMKLSGTSGWRAFELPFDSTGAHNPPKRLEVYLVMSGAGRVLISPLTLVDYAAGQWTWTPVSSGKPWWSNRDVALIGGIAGGVIGCYGGLLGWLMSRGRAREFVIRSMIVLTGLGVISLVAGLVALLLRQPFEVTYPLLLLGVLLASMFPYQLRQVRRRYAELELRRISAADALTR